MADLENVQALMTLIRAQERATIMKEIRAFAGDYHHHIDGRDVVIVEQLLTFLEGPQEK